ncbi:hypothetical protein LUZ60_015627 [Juncus effusus]|nr:hypothetical protein LUZ60_015627 [Juncus effusus]
MDAKSKAARQELRRKAISKNAAQDAIHILSAVSEDQPPSFRGLFSRSFSSSPVIDSVQHSEVLHTASSNGSSGLPPKSSSVARHALKNVAMSKSAADDVMEFLPEAEATDSFRWLFPRFRSSSSLSCDSSSSFHTCIQDEEVLNTDDDTEESQMRESESHSPSSSVMTNVEVDDTRSSDNINKKITTVAREGSQMRESESHNPSSSAITIAEVDVDDTGSSENINKETTVEAREQGGESKAKQPVARRRGWLEGWRKGTKTEKPEDGNAPVQIEVPRLSLANLKKKTGNFGAKALVGKGSYGTVYYAVLDDGKQAAIKYYHLHGGSKSNFVTMVSRVFRLKHENIAEMLGYCAEENYGILAYEFATRGSLYDILHGRNGVKNTQAGPVLSWMQRVRIAVDVAKALEYLHEKVQPYIIHGHVRSSNVLLFEGYKAKMNLSLSNQSPYINQNFRGIATPKSNWSHEYFPPEYFEVDDDDHVDPLYYAIQPLKATSNALTKKCDVYSFGVVLLELLTGRKPEHSLIVAWATKRLTEFKVKECVDPRLEGKYPSKGVAMLARVAAICLKYYPESRPSMSVVVEALSPLLVQKQPREHRGEGTLSPPCSKAA